MTDRPIIFSASMIRALLEGRKTQTRRLAWRAPTEEFMEYVVQVGAGVPGQIAGRPSPWQKVQPGDRLWVREAIAIIPTREIFSGRPGSHVAYRAGHLVIEDYGKPTQRTVVAPDHFADADTKWKPSIHMPRWASRLTLTVTEVRRQRLQDITEEDAIAEGVERRGVGWRDYEDEKNWYVDPRLSFASLWDSLHGPKSFNSQGEVTPLTFTVALRNIDAKEAA